MPSKACLTKMLNVINNIWIGLYKLYATISKFGRETKFASHPQHSTHWKESGTISNKSLNCQAWVEKEGKSFDICSVKPKDSTKVVIGRHYNIVADVAKENQDWLSCSAVATVINILTIPNPQHYLMAEAVDVENIRFNIIATEEDVIGPHLSLLNVDEFKHANPSESLMHASLAVSKGKGINYLIKDITPSHHSSNGLAGQLNNLALEDSPSLESNMPLAFFKVNQLLKKMRKHKLVNELSRLDPKFSQFKIKPTKPLIVSNSEIQCINKLICSKPIESILLSPKEARAVLETGKNLGLIFKGDEESILKHLSKWISDDRLHNNHLN
ncbi:hypothetical protein GH714_029048 [Hevea brasiliensis]|uniref:Uncharacterized protein n=1 Tax=Hevea brasiliensis TaxID=3981 RepID=A0A6A6M1B4_HEVBR|nr:hypothetical protein GH714_029048 [Hevea brasiliensis]